MSVAIDTPRMQCASAILSSVGCPALQYSSTLSHKRHDFRKEVTEHETRVSIFSTVLSGKFLIVRGTERDMIKSVYCSSCKVPGILTRF